MPQCCRVKGGERRNKTEARKKKENGKGRKRRKRHKRRKEEGREERKRERERETHTHRKWRRSGPPAPPRNKKWLQNNEFLEVIFRSSKRLQARRSWRLLPGISNVNIISSIPPAMDYCVRCKNSTCTGTHLITVFAWTHLNSGHQR